jgi:hypothetical protein
MNDILKWIEEEYRGKKKDKEDDRGGQVAPSITKSFTIHDFVKNLNNKAVVEKFEQYLFSDNITAYDIAYNCILQVLFRLNNIPVESLESKWLPVLLRAIIGSAVHKFIQLNYDFDEVEVPVKIPEIRFSGKVDAIIGGNTLVEIKTVTLNDFNLIRKKNLPRKKDFIQLYCYKYLMEEYQEKGPYNKFQFIYIYNGYESQSTQELIEVNDVSADTSLSQFKNIIHVLTIDNVQNEQVEDYIKRKLDVINTHLDKGTYPSCDNEFIDKRCCYFCLYKKICKCGK